MTACKACRSSPPHLRLAAPERQGAGATQGSKGSYRGPRHGLRGWCALSEACHTRLQAKRSAPGPPAVAQKPWKSAATVSALLKILTLGCRGRFGGGKTDQARGGPGPRQPGDGGIQRPTSNRLRCAGSGALNRPGGGPGSRTSPPPCGWEAFAPSTRSTRDDPRPAEIRPRGIQRCLREGREDRRATAIHRRHAPASDSEDGPNFPNAKQWQQRAAGRSARDV